MLKLRDFPCRDGLFHVVPGGALKTAHVMLSGFTCAGQHGKHNVLFARRRPHPFLLVENGEWVCWCAWPHSLA